MTLYINTTAKDEMTIGLRDGDKVLVNKKIISPRQQAEKLLPSISRLLESKKIKLSQLTKIIVANQGGSFTSLRIGVITANALAYALKIPVEAEPKTPKKNKSFSEYSIIEPIYSSEPNIGKAKSLL